MYIRFFKTKPPLCLFHFTTSQYRQSCFKKCILDFLKLNPHCAFFILLQALFRTGSKKNSPYIKIEPSPIQNGKELLQLNKNKLSVNKISYLSRWEMERINEFTSPLAESAAPAPGVYRGRRGHSPGT